jgi:dihydropteroate synthase
MLYQMVEDGAQIIDIGGESTKDQAASVVSDNEEQDRVLPVIDALIGCECCFIPRLPIRHQTMQLACEAGIRYIE